MCLYKQILPEDFVTVGGMTDPPWRNDGGRPVRLSGALTIAGQTRPFEVTAKVTSDGSSALSQTTSLDVDRARSGVQPGPRVDEHVDAFRRLDTSEVHDEKGLVGDAEPSTGNDARVEVSGRAVPPVDAQVEGGHFLHGIAEPGMARVIRTSRM